MSLCDVAGQYFTEFNYLLWQHCSDKSEKAEKENENMNMEKQYQLVVLWDVIAMSQFHLQRSLSPSLASTFEKKHSNALQKPTETICS